MNCPHCHAPIVAGARFCPACGKAAAPTDSATSAPPSGSAPDFAGREIAGRYRILKKIGEGGMGAVYRGEQMSLKRSIAIKLLKPELGNDQLILRRFNAEAEAVAKLNHPNTVNIYELGQDVDGTLFIAMEFIEGRSLREVIQREGPFSPTRALAIAAQIAAALADAHSHSIVHRDLKPDNVMLQDRGKQRDVVRVLDFGIAKLRDDSRATQAMTQAGDMLGTPQYMAPEQIRGEAIDGRVDIYALACIIYEMVTARLPYEAPTVMAILSKHLLEEPIAPSQRRPDLQVPPAIDALVLRAMAKDPAARPHSMDEFSDMILAILQTLPADPNRSASLQHAAVASATPTGPGGAFAPTPPPPMTPGNFAPFSPAPTPPGPAPYIPPPMPPTVPVGRRRTPSNMVLYIALGVLAVGVLAGVGIAVSRRANKPNTVEPRPDDDDKEDDDKPDKPDEPDDAATPNPDDPWAAKDPGARAPLPPAQPAAAPAPKPAAPKIGTAMTPIPPGARINPPAGFTESGANVYKGPNNQIIFLGQLSGGTNDLNKLAAMWTKETGFKKVSTSKLSSAGKMRPAIAFAKTDGNVAFGQIAVLYLEPGYRLGVVYTAPGQMFTDAAFNQQVESFFKHNVVMP